jgi:hypothetical protein
VLAHSAASLFVATIPLKFNQRTRFLSAVNDGVSAHYIR